ncbi:hypothetical protein GS597_03740 [Synechococcales cyanobacterium C]|uniref:Uncharacterized protein n=1 Tax=Petrachloros mirabilis ULC683 TaxID=2781853 RepID=A0A8K2A6W8_9CYAN|nr:hypothetical protein [Petrachloros mirabilis]NCJ05634.1 hypothetical protein [Petrachloros mirabilis ULC683]
MKKQTKVLGLILLFLLGSSYFSAFSNLEVPLPWLKGFAVLLPVQVGVLIYFAYRAYSSKLPPQH